MFVKVLVPLVVLGGVVFFLFGFLGAMKDRPSSNPTPPVTVNLGHAASSGSTWQAKELLAAISKNARASKVTITATDVSGQYVEFSADLKKDELVRVHPGRTPEVWNGQIMSRLRTAADGGSLN